MTLDITLGAVWMFGTLIIVTAAVTLAPKKGSGVLLGLYAGLVVISSISATKMISIFGQFVPAGVLIYAASFLLTDILSEVYGQRQARTAVWTGTLCMLVFFAYSWVTVVWPSAPYWDNQEAYGSIVGLSARIAFAGLVAFIISQMNDIWIFHLLKAKHKRSKLALQNILSTCTSQLIDTIIFITIAFYGVFPVLDLIIAQYAVKLVVAIADTPFAYIARWYLEKSPKNMVIENEP